MGDGARISREPGSLIGRDDDLEYLTAFVDRAAVSGGALLLSGEAGVGKTVLLDAAVAYAGTAGRRVLRAAGAEFEGEVSFAGLNQLLGPMLDQSQSQSTTPRPSAASTASSRSLRPRSRPAITPGRRPRSRCRDGRQVPGWPGSAGNSGRRRKASLKA